MLAAGTPRLFLHPTPNCFYHAYKTALISSHEKGHGPLLRTAYGAPSWARVKHICPQGAERMGSLEYVFTLLPVNSSLLQVMLASVSPHCQGHSYLITPSLSCLLILLNSLKTEQLGCFGEDQGKMESEVVWTADQIRPVQRQARSPTKLPYLILPSLSFSSSPAQFAPAQQVTGPPDLVTT